MERKELKRKIVNEVLKCIQKQVVFNRSINYKMEVKAQNIYFWIHRYQTDFKVNIYADGNIQLKFNEVCHKEYTCDYYQFKEEDNLELLVRNFKKDMNILLKDFIEYPMSWHVIMDYLNQDDQFLDMKLLRNDDQWIKNYKSIRKYF
ncbi:hypothetical protein [Thomasclavelia ramosa]|uniref:hypothetical protein n=1 Tax=Thomasclavelia ramosa TaxID=1547 RepID=UPI00189DA46F|nr:hypothetical protein [Thomasclavelia ramosa]